MTGPRTRNVAGLDLAAGHGSFLLDISDNDPKNADCKDDASNNETDDHRLVVNHHVLSFLYIWGHASGGRR